MDTEFSVKSVRLTKEEEEEEENHKFLKPKNSKMHNQSKLPINLVPSQFWPGDEVSHKFVSMYNVVLISIA